AGARTARSAIASGRATTKARSPCRPTPTSSELATMLQTAATAERFQDIRDAVRALCAEFPDAYHRRIDAERAYPEAFVEALTKAGWLAAMIPMDYSGSAPRP